jgi:2-oxo-hept-3-ene-1,7-dioate hydratase
MINSRDRAAAAKALLEAERSRTPAPKLSQTYPELEIADSYEIQRLVIAEKLARGALIKGHKIGLTSRVMQQTAGIDEPDFGHLLDHMILGSDAPIDASQFMVPRLEVELAFILGRDLDMPDPSITDVLAATEFVQPALEIIDSRTLTPRKVTDTIADNSACGAIVLGGRPVRPMDIDLRWVSAVLYRNGVIEESGVSAAVMGHPATAVVWLAKRLAKFDTQLRCGQIILAGSFTRPVELRAGDVFVADYGPLGLIPVSFR